MNHPTTQNSPEARRDPTASNPPSAVPPTALPGHSLQANDRREMLVRGVCEVLSFDEQNVRLVTTAGILNLEGRELRIHTLNTKDGVVAVTGILDGVLYETESNESADRTPVSGKRRFGRSR